MVNYCQVCGREADKLCAACKLIYYCSVECQRSHWKNGHKKCCGLFMVADCGGGGDQKCLKASRDIERGSVLLIEFPMFHCPLVMKVEETFGSILNKQNYLICVTCSKNLVGVKSTRCSRCKFPCCSKECEQHKSHADYECEILASKQILHDSLKVRDDLSLVTTLRLLQLKKKNPGLWKQLLYFCPGKFDIKNPKLIRMMKKLGIFDTDAFNLSAASLRSLKGFSISEFDKETRQAQKLTNGREDFPVRVNIFFFQNASHLVRTCAPNTIWWITDFPEWKLTLRSTRPIKSGEVLSMPPQIDGNLDYLRLGTVPRRVFILSLSQTRCFCKRCSDPTEFRTYYSAVACSSCQNEVKSENSIENDPNLGYFLLANPNTTLSSDDELSAVKGTDADWIWKCNRCGASKSHSTIGQELDTFSTPLRNVKSWTVSSLKKVIEENKTLHPNHFLMVNTKMALLEAENKKFGEFSRFPHKIQRKNTRAEKIQLLRELIKIDDQLLQGSWTTERAFLVSELADSLIKNYCETLDELDFAELEILLGEVDEGIGYFEEAIFISKNIDPKCRELANKVPEFLEKIKVGQELKSQIQNYISQNYEIEETIENTDAE